MLTQGRCYKNHFVWDARKADWGQAGRQTHTHTLPDSDKEAKKKNAPTNNEGTQHSRLEKEDKVRRKDTRGHEQRQTHTIIHTKGLCVGWSLQGGFRSAYSAELQCLPANTEYESETSRGMGRGGTGKSLWEISVNAATELRRWMQRRTR